jgi:hypothetical protein
MEIMPMRYGQLQEALEGYRETGRALVAHSAEGFRPAGFSDDIGSYYFIPKLAVVAGLPLDEAITAFYWLIMSGAVILGCAGFALLFRSTTALLLSATMLGVLSYVTLFRVRDVYVVSCAVPLALIPVFLWIAKSDAKGFVLTAFSGVAGLCISLAHYVRSHSGTGVLVFLFVAIFWHLQLATLRRFTVLGTLVLGMLIGHGFFQVLITERDRYLTEHAVNEVVPLTKHPFWHSVYIGLGFLNNDYGITYLDEVAIEKVRSVAPSARYLSDDYEQVLRQEVIRVISDHPVFFLRTLFAKFGVIIMYMLISINVGLLTLRSNPIPQSLTMAFWCAIVFHALVGFLVIPTVSYLLGMIAFGALYTVLYLNMSIVGTLPRIQGVPLSFVQRL